MARLKYGRERFRKTGQQSALELAVQDVDWEKLVKLPGIEIVANLMISLNDLLALAYLTDLHDRDSEARPILGSIQSGALGLLLRSQIGILWSAKEYFVDKALDSKNKFPKIREFLDTFHEAHPEIQEKYDRFVTLSNEKKTNGIRDMRNNFSFHLNWLNQSELTSAAIQGKYEELKARGTTVVPGMMYGNTPECHRVLIGDSVLNKAWRTLYGDIPDSDDFTDEKTKQAKDIVSTLGRAYIVWAESLIEQYLLNGDVMTGKPTPLKAVKNKVYLSR